MSRSLLLSATIGMSPLLQVGCAPQAVPSASAERATGALTEEELCSRALTTHDPDVLETLLRQYPTGSCVIPTLTAMPPQVLAQISPAVLRDLPAPVRFRIPSSVAIHLRLPAQRDTFSERGSGASNGASLRASRAFGGPAEYPPDDFTGYGIVAFNARPTLDRGHMFCEAYASIFATDQRLVDHGIPTDRQMVTVWPVETERGAAAARNADSDADACAIAVSQYGILIAEDAIADANRADLAGTIGGLSGEGPFLLAWAPGEKKGEPDVLVLVADLTNVATAEQARRDFMRWKEDIQQNPELWEQGWSQQNIQILIQRWADSRSQGLLMLIGLAQ